MSRARLARHTPKNPQPQPSASLPVDVPIGTVGYGADFYGLGVYGGPAAPTLTTVDGIFLASDPLIQQWYTKIVDLPNLGAAAAIDTYSPTIIGDWVPQQGNFLVPIRSYTIPVFKATAQTPRVDVNLDGGNAGGPKIKNVPMDTTWIPSSGTDSQIVVIDPVAGCMYDYVNFRRNTPSAGQYTASWAFGSSYPSPGGFPNNAGARASGLELLLGMIRPDEIIAGLIPHAIGCSCGNQMPTPQTPANDGGAYFSAGGAVPPHGVPCGARFRLKLSFNVASIVDANQRIVAKALQDYGGIIIDGTGSGVTTGAANPDLSVWGSTWSNVPGMTSGPYWYLDQIPVSQFEVLQFTGKVIPQPVQSPVSNACTTYGS